MLRINKWWWHNRVWMLKWNTLYYIYYYITISNFLKTMKFITKMDSYMSKAEIICKIIGMCDSSWIHHRSFIIWAWIFYLMLYLNPQYHYNAVFQAMQKYTVYKMIIMMFYIFLEVSPKVLWLACFFVWEKRSLVRPLRFKTCFVMLSSLSSML